MPEHEQFSSRCCSRGNMTKEVNMRIPEPLLETQDHLHDITFHHMTSCTLHHTYLVEEAKSEVIDGLCLPLGKRRVERDDISLQNTQWDTEDHSICSEDGRAASLGGASVHFNPYMGHTHTVSHDEMLTVCIVLG